jgi:hypothetical protein
MSTTAWKFIGINSTQLTSAKTPNARGELTKAFNAKETRSIREVLIATYALELVGHNMHMGRSTNHPAKYSI